MATRISGQLKLTILLQPDNSYRVRFYEIGKPGQLRRAMTGLPLSPFNASRLASDSSEAYDAIATAAVSFAEDEDKSGLLTGLLDFDDNGDVMFGKVVS